MIQLPDDIVAKDVHQWLDGGWFYADRGKGPELARLNQIHPDGLQADVRFFDEKYTLLPFNKLFAEWPMCGSLNIFSSSHGKITSPGNFAVSLLRLQKKQWKRTYNSHCLKLKTISETDAHFVYSPGDKPIVGAAFSPVYFTYTQAVNQNFNAGWVSVAINPNLIIMKSIDSRILIFVDGEFVGAIDENNKFVCLNPGLKRRLLPHLDYAVE